MAKMTTKELQRARGLVHADVVKAFNCFWDEAQRTADVVDTGQVPNTLELCLRLTKLNKEITRIKQYDDVLYGRPLMQSRPSRRSICPIPRPVYPTDILPIAQVRVILTPQREPVFVYGCKLTREQTTKLVNYGYRFGSYPAHGGQTIAGWKWKAK